ncbi:7 transmembrane receptor -like protein 3 [Dermatophagoides farinae]|uniref:7 transmembrane receptor -like protein 3 n=1 Tax=Dermatophagoides farinae TaxID=6954 RepID=A0A9D4P2V8_DERFA|nr:7 transmembrane receptor -like protein 3 [Dermatophagoides farinae]
MEIEHFNMTHLAIQANETLKELLEFEDSLDSFVGNMTGTAESLYTALEFSKIFHYIAAIFGVIGNLLVIIIYLKNHRIRTVTNTYILNVAISDLLYVITVPVFLISIWSNSWPFGEFVCKLLLSKGAIHRFASSLFLLVLVIDTYLSILKPTLSHICYKRPINSRMICILTWIICIISVSPVFYHASTFSVPNSEINHCDLFWTGSSREAYIWFTIISAFIIPTIIKILLAVPLIYTLAGENSSDTIASEGQYQVFAERNKRSAHLILTVIVFHILCWLPLWISLISVNLLPMNEMPDNSAILFHMISGCLGMANTVLNPFIYFKLSPEFRNGFAELKESILYRSKASIFANGGNGNGGGGVLENSTNSNDGIIGHVNNGVNGTTKYTTSILATLTNIEQINENSKIHQSRIRNLKRISLTELRMQSRQMFVEE